MGNYRRFTGGGGGEFFKFEEDGTVLEGVVNGFKEGKFDNTLCLMNVDGKSLQVGCNAGLIRCFEEAFGSLERVPHGVKVRIEFEGWGKTKNGQDFKKFNLDVDEDAIENPPF